MNGINNNKNSSNNSSSDNNHNNSNHNNNNSNNKVAMLVSHTLGVKTKEREAPNRPFHVGDELRMSGSPHYIQGYNHQIICRHVILGYSIQI